jgi:hypothetical protein
MYKLNERARNEDKIINTDAKRIDIKRKIRTLVNYGLSAVSMSVSFLAQADVAEAATTLCEKFKSCANEQMKGVLEQTVNAMCASLAPISKQLSQQPELEGKAEACLNSMIVLSCDTLSNLGTSTTA